MKQCLRCLWYDEVMDGLYPDCFATEEEAKEAGNWHTCDKFDRIPDDIVNDKKRCKQYLPNAKEMR